MAHRRWLPRWIRKPNHLLWAVAMIAIVASLIGDVALRSELHDSQAQNKHFAAAVYQDCLSNHDVWVQRIAQRAATITEEIWQIRNLNSDIDTINGVISYSHAQQSAFTGTAASNYSQLIATYQSQESIKRQTIDYQERRLATLQQAQNGDLAAEPNCAKLRLQSTRSAGR